MTAAIIKAIHKMPGRLTELIGWGMGGLFILPDAPAIANWASARRADSRKAGLS
jgi:hypothetical protein